MIVFDDADVSAAAEWIQIAGYFNSGQDCTAATRVIAGPKVYENLVSEVVSKVSEMKVGDIFDDEAAMGSVVSDVQLDRIRGFVDRAREGGATINIGGEVIDRAGLVVRAHGRDRRRAGLRDHPERGVRSGRDRAAVLGRGRRARVGQRRRLRPRGLGLDAGRRTGAADVRASSSSARCGSTPTSRSRPRCRTAATSRAGTARTCRSTRSRSTRTSST